MENWLNINRDPRSAKSLTEKISAILEYLIKNARIAENISVKGVTKGFVSSYAIG